jgi:hypothetical protein
MSRLTGTCLFMAISMIIIFIAPLMSYWRAGVIGGLVGSVFVIGNLVERGKTKR